jgi:ABC-2 type transport system permease protein
MNTQLAVTTSEPVTPPVTRASFTSMMRGEFLKIARLFWLLLAILTVLFAGGFVIGANLKGIKTDLQHTPLHFLDYSMQSNLVIFRILSGILLLILTSFVVGREYQYGTIRILLARGAGRVQLLLVKLAMLALLALLLLIAFTLLTELFTCIQILILNGNLNALSALRPAFWSAFGIEVLATAISMGATILLAAAMNALGRSLTFGLSVSLVWFPIDNMGTLVMDALSHLTHSDFWLNATAYFLGPLLNRLPDWVLPEAAQSGFQSFGVDPLVTVNASHALWVIGAYALIFFVAALVPTWKRDVKE